MMVGEHKVTTVVEICLGLNSATCMKVAARMLLVELLLPQLLEGRLNLSRLEVEARL